MAATRYIRNTGTITLPAHWASYLVNGDASGLDAGEVAEIDEYLASELEPGWSVVDVNRDGEGDFSPRFTWSFSLYGGNASGGDVLEYVIRRN